MEDLAMHDYTEEAATFGDRLAFARENQGLSQAQLAKRLGLKVDTVKNWEADRSEPRANKLQMLAAFLNVSMVWLMTGEGEGAPVVETQAEVSGPVGEAILEIRALKLLQMQTADRLSRLEKALKTVAADE